nr:hypothetical protein [Tanacetum cinerariifolium]
MITAQVDDLFSHNTKYTSPALTQKVFENMRRIGKGFSGVETHLFDTMLVQPQVQDTAELEEDEDDNEVSAAPTPPSPTQAPLPPQQDPIPLPPQAQPAQSSSPPQEQPTQSTHTLESLMTLLNTLMETCATLTQKVAHLEHDKVAQALKIVKLKQRVKKLEKKRRSKSLGLKRLRKVGTSQRVESSNNTVVDTQEDASKQEGKIAELDADEDVTLVNVDITVEMDANIQERMEEDVTAVKEVNAAEPTVFDDEEVTMTMAQTLIKMKAKKARILDEQMAKRLQDEEIEQAAARERHEKEDLERAKIQEKHLDNIKKYQILKRKPISVAQARKNMIVYLKNMAGYKIQHFKGMTYDQVRPIFEREYNHVQTYLESDRDEEPTKKRLAKETLLQESFKKLRAKVEVSGSSSTQQDTPTVDPAEIFEEDVKNMLQIILMAEFKVEALQVKYPLIDWEIHFEGSRSYWKIIRVGGIIEAYQSFEDMLKSFDRDDPDALWRLVKEKLNTSMPTVDKEKALWDYPLTDVVLFLMLSAKLQVDEDSLESMLFKTSRKCIKGLLLLVEVLVLPMELIYMIQIVMKHLLHKQVSWRIFKALILKSPLSSATSKGHHNQQLEKHIQEFKGKSVFDCSKSVNKSKVIASVVLKLDLEPLSSKLKNNREAHVDYMRITKENTDTLRDIVEQARISNPLDNALAYACMYMKQIQELLVYVSDTRPNSPLKSEKSVAVTPMNKAKKFTFCKD